MIPLNESQTRRDVIDPILEKTGWFRWNKRYVKEEVNSVASDFKKKDYKFHKTNERGVDRFIDYLLLDENHAPLAIIEAKRTSISVEKGEIQAKSYREDIEKQISEKIPIFLTNGIKWYFVDEHDRRRRVYLPFSQKDLTRRHEIYKKERDASKIKINSKIVDRHRSIESVKIVLQHFMKGHREALVSMATGTGKTRVSMAIIDSLIRAGFCRRVLFVVDRISLASQAKTDGFSKFFEEPVHELHLDGFSDTSRFYVSTVQTLMSEKKPRGRFYELFGVASFDLIIYDEAHRSYYDKNNDVLKYFDAIKLGLTATPSLEGDRDTFKLFGCEHGKPTVYYSYDEAVKDGVLVPYTSEIISTKVLSLGIEGKKLTKDLKDVLRQQEEDPEQTELPGSRFEKIFTDPKTNELIVREFIDRCYRSNDGRPCKTIFFCASVKHAESLKIIFDKLYPTLAKDVSVITSDRSRYMDEVRRFKRQSSPRVALSVGVLDTGVNIPEICNLVFVKPVFSKTRFWQMLGRGTRNMEACKYVDWLPTKDNMPIKDDFLILDFKFGEHSNVLYHELDLTKVKSQTQDTKTKIFLQQLELLKKTLDEGEKRIIEEQIKDSIRAIDDESPLVKEKQKLIKKFVTQKFDLKEHITTLKQEIAPLLIYSKAENSKIYTFINKCVQLFEAMKNNDKEKIFTTQQWVCERLENIWEKDLRAVKEKKYDIRRILDDSFWSDLGFEDVDFLIRDVSPLMIYYDVEKKKMLNVSAPDFITNVEEVKMKVKEDPEMGYFLKSNLLLKQIRDGHGVTPNELLELESELSALNPSWTIKNIQDSLKTDFLSFLRSLLEIKEQPEPETIIRFEFEKHVMNKNHHYTAEQLRFLRYLRDVFIRAKNVELKDFAKHPLTEERPLDLFTKEDLEKIVNDCKKIKMR